MLTFKITIKTVTEASMLSTKAKYETTKIINMKLPTPSSNDALAEMVLAYLDLRGQTMAIRNIGSLKRGFNIYFDTVFNRFIVEQI